MKIKLFLAIFTLLISFRAFASCTLEGAIQNLTFGFLQNHTTVGSDRPVGYIILGQNNQARTVNQTVKCTESGQLMINRNYEAAATLVPSGISGSYGGPVYRTNIQGLGFYYFSISKPLDSSNTSAICTANVASCTFTPSQSFIGVRIIKTGNVIPGSVLRGSDLPCVEIKAGLPASMVTVKRICINGNITVENLTCNTPANVDVPLGTHHVSNFYGVNSTTNWVDASIKLTNCPPLKGYALSGNSYDDGSLSNITNSQNRLTLVLNPVNGITDAVRGIINLSSKSTAKGVGIQIASGTAASATPLNFNNAVQGSIDVPYTSAISDLTVPLVARYVQTQADLTPGTANGQVIYTINYY